MRRYMILWVSMLAGLAISPAARADSILVVPSVSGSPGDYTYSYEIENQTSVGLLLFSLTVTGDVGALDAPTGWLDTTSIVGPSETLVEWFSTDIPYDVPALGTLSGFSLTSDSEPGTAAFSTFDENFSEFDGQTTGPVGAPTPEPQTLFVLFTSLISICIFRRCRGNNLISQGVPNSQWEPLIKAELQKCIEQEKSE